MTASTSQTSTAAQNHAFHAPEGAKHFGMAQPATEENSQAQVLKFDDFSPKSDQAQSDQAQQSDTTQQSDQSEDRTCGVTENFTRMVTAAITLGSGSREKSRQALHADYVVAHAYENAGDHKDAYKATLEKQCAEATPKIDVTDGKTTPFHMIVKLTFTDVTKQFVSDKVHVLRVALAHSVKPDGFVKWLHDEHGERKIVETYNRDGSKKPPKPETAGNSTTNATHSPSKVDLDLVRAQLKSSALITLDKGSIGNALDDLKTDIELSAIVVRQADGTFVVKTVVEDSEAVDAVYAGYYKENAEQIKSAVTRQKIEEMLEQADDITISDIRKKLGDEIADKIKSAWETDRQFNIDMSATPAALQEYVKKLRKADWLHNMHGESAAESAYQAALDELEQTLEADPSLRQYLDRDWSDDISSDKESVPRLNNSKSMERKGNGPQIISKDQSLREALRAELDNLRGANVTDACTETARLASAMQLANKRTLN
jgi:hypothetical protein